MHVNVDAHMEHVAAAPACKYDAQWHNSMTTHGNMCTTAFHGLIHEQTRMATHCLMHTGAWHHHASHNAQQYMPNVSMHAPRNLITQAQRRPPAVTGDVGFEAMMPV
jgi:hypothetical protein